LRNPFDISIGVVEGLLHLLTAAFGPSRQPHNVRFWGAAAGIRTRYDAIDPGCVKTPQAEKQGEWTFSDRSKIDRADKF
jgi:hypothetical protein